jgi:hypothetical protein
LKNVAVRDLIHGVSPFQWNWFAAVQSVMAAPFGLRREGRLIACIRGAAVDGSASGLVYFDEGNAGG